MAIINVAFDSEEEAERIVARLSEANLGDVRARVISSSESLSHNKTSRTSPVITPELGAIEVRPTETPEDPDQQQEHSGDRVSAHVPAEERANEGVHVVIEFDDQYEQAVRQILSNG